MDAPACDKSELFILFFCIRILFYKIFILE